MARLDFPLKGLQIGLLLGICIASVTSDTCLGQAQKGPDELLEARDGTIAASGEVPDSANKRSADELIELTNGSLYVLKETEILPPKNEGFEAFEEPLAWKGKYAYIPRDENILNVAVNPNENYKVGLNAQITLATSANYYPLRGQGNLVPSGGSGSGSGGESEPEKQHWAAMVSASSARILRDIDGYPSEYMPLEGDYGKALIGQWINLSIDFDMPGNVQVTSFEWTLPDGAFKDYAASTNSATLTRHDADSLSTHTIIFYAAKPTASESFGTKISCKVTLSTGEVLDIEDEIFFHAPTLQNGSVSGGSPVVHEKTTLEHGTRAWLELVGDNDSAHGFVIEAAVEMPFGYTEGTSLIDSKWEYWQTVNTSRYARYLDGSKLLGWETNGTWALDTKLPYGGWTGGPWIPIGSNSHETNDSPGNTVESANIRYETNNEQFRMYIMFMPEGENSRYVPLTRTDWNWSGHAQYDNTDQEWKLVAGTAASPTISTTTYPDHPTWTFTAVAEDINYVEIE